MGHLPVHVDASPTLLPGQITALYALRKAARGFRIIQGRTQLHEIVVQTQDEVALRTWVLDAHGAAHICDDLVSPHCSKPYPRHPLVELGCPTLGCDIRCPLTAEGIALLSYVFALADQARDRPPGARGLVEQIERGVLCPNHSLELVEIPRVR